MKNLSIIAIIATFFLVSCGGGPETDLDTKKADLEKIEGQIDSLKSVAFDLKEEIAELDSTTTEIVKAVTIVEATETPFDHYLTVSGTSYAENNVQVTTDMGGLVKAVYVNEGQYVSAGAIMFQMDNSTILPQIEEIKTGLDLATSVFQKRENLWNQNIGSEIEYLQAKNQMESLQKSLATANSQLAKTTIKAPISGYVDAVNLQVGNMASPGHAAAQVVNLSQMEIHANVPEVYVGTVKKGDKVMVDFPVLGLEKEATVESVGQNISTGNRTFKVIASIANSKNELKPNMLADIKINDLSLEKAIAIPSKLIQESSHDYFVFVAQTDSTNGKTIATKKVVVPGESYDGNTVIETGLEAGDLVIDEGYRTVLEGSLVEINE
ncbi:MAG: efflux RND transporter periplasmic adaptor subunit [Chitinophagales bacterium]